MPAINEHEDCQSEDRVFIESESTSTVNDDLLLKEPHICENLEPKEQPSQVQNFQKDKKPPKVNYDTHDQFDQPLKTMPPAPGWAKTYHIPYPPVQMFHPLPAFNLFNTDENQYSQPCLRSSNAENFEEEPNNDILLEEDDQPMLSEKDESSQSDSASDYNSATEEQQQITPQTSPSPQRQRRPKRHCPKPMFQYDDIVSAKRRKK